MKSNYSASPRVALGTLLLLGAFSVTVSGQEDRAGREGFNRAGRESVSLSAHAPVVTTAPAAQAVRIEPVAPVTQPIRIEVGKDIAKSVEIKQVPGNEIKVLSATATVIHTPPPIRSEQHAEGHHVEVTPAPTARATSSPRSTP